MNGFCDCGSPAAGKDGSGYFCSPCKVAVSKAQADLAAHIVKTRAEANQPDIAARHAQASREWDASHREERREYARKYQREKRARNRAIEPAYQFNRYQKAA